MINSTIGFNQMIDAHLWTGIGLDASINKKIDISYKTQTRFYQNVSMLRVYYNQIGVSYKITKDLDAEFNYRFSRKRKKDFYFESENRLMLNLSYDYKIDAISTKLSFRLRYQNSFDRIKPINDVIYPNISNKIRFKTTAKYKNKNFKKIQPYISYEIFKSLDAEPIEFSLAQRYAGGFHLDLPNKQELKLAYIYQRNNGSIIEIRHIYMIHYTYSLGKLLKRKK